MKPQCRKCEYLYVNPHSDECFCMHQYANEQQIVFYYKQQRRPKWCPLVMFPEVMLKPCPKCGSPVELKWIAGMSRSLVELFGHPFNGRASWYIWCTECGNRLDMPVTKPSGQEQDRVKKKIIREWNRRDE